MASNVMTRGGFSDLMYPGLNKAYLLAYNEYPVEYTQFLNVDSSTKRQEEESTTVGFGLVPLKTEGDQPVLDVMEHVSKLTYTHDTYVLGYEVTEELFEDELYGIVKQGSRALAVAVKQTVDTLGTIVLNKAFDGDYKGTDGEALCSEEHPAKKTGTFVSNRPAADVDFSATALDSAVEAIELWTNDNDLPLMIKPKHVVSGPGQRKLIYQTLGAQRQPFAGADSQPNAIQDWSLTQMILHYLDDSDAWFILSNKADHFMKMFWRVKPRFRNYDDPDTGNARFLVRFRASFGFTHWWGVYGCPGT